MVRPLILSRRRERMPPGSGRSARSAFRFIDSLAVSFHSGEALRVAQFEPSPIRGDQCASMPSTSAGTIFTVSNARTLAGDALFATEVAFCGIAMTAARTSAARIHITIASFRIVSSRSAAAAPVGLGLIGKLTPRFHAPYEARHTAHVYPYGRGSPHYDLADFCRRLANTVRGETRRQGDALKCIGNRERMITLHGIGRGTAEL